MTPRVGLRPVSIAQTSAQKRTRLPSRSGRTWMRQVCNVAARHSPALLARPGPSRRRPGPAPTTCSWTISAAQATSAMKVTAWRPAARPSIAATRQHEHLAAAGRQLHIWHFGWHALCAGRQRHDVRALRPLGPAGPDWSGLHGERGRRRAPATASAPRRIARCARPSYAANAHLNGGTPDEIRFALPGAGPHIIQVSSRCPR